MVEKVRRERVFPLGRTLEVWMTRERLDLGIFGGGRGLGRGGGSYGMGGGLRWAGYFFVIVEVISGETSEL